MRCSHWVLGIGYRLELDLQGHLVVELGLEG